MKALNQEQDAVLDFHNLGSRIAIIDNCINQSQSNVFLAILIATADDTEAFLVHRELAKLTHLSTCKRIRSFADLELELLHFQPQVLIVSDRFAGARDLDLTVSQFTKLAIIHIVDECPKTSKVFIKRTQMNQLCSAINQARSMMAAHESSVRESPVSSSLGPRQFGPGSPAPDTDVIALRAKPELPPVRTNRITIGETEQKFALRIAELETEIEMLRRKIPTQESAAEALSFRQRGQVQVDYIPCSYAL